MEGSLTFPGRRVKLRVITPDREFPTGSRIATQYVTNADTIHNIGHVAIFVGSRSPRARASCYKGKHHSLAPRVTRESTTRWRSRELPPGGFVGYAGCMMNATIHPRNPVNRGFFISLDGPDGCGKTTQAASLVAWLTEQGREVVACRDPGGTALGDRLRSILLGRHDVAIGMRSEMLLYMASRAQLVDEVIRPALAAGRIVVCDRYLLANVVYQGRAGGLPVEELWQVGRVATGGLTPDLTIVLDIAPETARERTGGPRDRIEDRGPDFQQRVREGFLREAETYPAPIVVLDASAPTERVALSIRSEVARVLGQSPRT